MSTPVPDHPDAGRLLPFRVAQPVSTAGCLRWSQELAYLLSYNVAPVYSGVVRTTDLGTHSVALAYQRSAGAKALLVTVELVEGTSIQSGVFNWSLDGASSVYIAGAAYDGATLAAPKDRVRLPPIHELWIDVAAVGNTTPKTLLLTWTPTNAGKSALYRVHVVEVPLRDLDPTGAPTTEPGVSSSWATPDGRLVDSTPDQGFGFARIFDALDQARAATRRHLQVAVPEVSAGTYSYTTASTSFVTLSGKFFTRARRLYSTAVANQYTLWVRYKAAAGATVRLTTDAGNTDVVLPSTGAFLSATSPVSLPCSTTDQDVQIQFSGKTTSAGSPLYVSTFALIENET